MGCAMGLVKYLVFFFNLIFALAGLALLIVGVLFKLNFDDMTQVVESSPVSIAPTLMIVIAAIIFVIAFFGCCGAIRENTCMLTTYAVILLAILILQIALGVFVLIKIKDEDDLKTAISKDVNKTFDKVKAGNSSAIESFEILQSSFKCCGVNGKQDWSFWGNGTLPKSCCKDLPPTCPYGKGFKDGCSEKVFETLTDNSSTIGYVALGLCATELIAAIFSLCLQSSIKNERRRDGYY